MGGGAKDQGGEDGRVISKQEGMLRGQAGTIGSDDSSRERLSGSDTADPNAWWEKGLGVLVPHPSLGRISTENHVMRCHMADLPFCKCGPLGREGGMPTLPTSLLG